MACDHSISKSYNLNRCDTCGEFITPSPKPCCGLCYTNKRWRGWIGSGSSRKSQTGVVSACKNPSCPNCHQAKPEGKCKDYECSNKSDCQYLPPEVSPAKEEKEVCEKLGYVHNLDSRDHQVQCTPTLTEQKGEWEEEFDEKFVELRFGNGSPKGGGKGVYRVPKEATGIDDIKSFIAAKKKEWEAQKEQAVKAEIRERIKYYKFEEKSAEYNQGYIDAREDVLSLLSDKVNH